MQKRNPMVREYFRAFYRNNHLLYAVALVTLILSVPGNLIASWLLGGVLDLIAARDLERLWWMARFTAVFVAVNLVVEIVMYRAKTCFIQRALLQYKDLAFSRLSAKSISAFSRENTGRYISVLTNDVNSIEENYLNRTLLMVFHLALFVATLIMMFWYSWKLALTAIGLSIIPVVVSVLMGGQLAVREKQVSDQNEKFVSSVKDLLMGFSVIKSFKAEGEARALFGQENHEVEALKRRRRWWENLLTMASNSFCAPLVQFGIFLVGAYLAIRGQITAGTVLIMTNLCNFLLMPIQTVPQYWASRKAARALVEKLAEVVEENSGRGGESIEPKLDGAIELTDVSFAYDANTPVLEDVNLRFEAGKKYAIVGASGSGKTTLLNLLMGAYDGYTGTITLDGRELRTVSTDSLYDIMSLIGQSVFLFDDTLQNNITMFRDFPPEQVARAAEQSGLTALIEARGMDYVCGENGVNLSGGERQRVSIARCLLRGTPILMLDEATAALDAKTAFEVTDAILHIEGLTRLVVTHRMESALLEQYDGIIVLRAGRVCEQGSFSELMAQKGFFYSLYTVSN